MRKEIIRFENVTMSEQDTVFLNNFSFYITESEIVGLESINDKGEQELIRLFCMNLPIKAGRVYWRGKQVNSYQSSDFSRNNVYLIDQKSTLIDALSVADNIFVMRPGFKKYLINERVLKEQARLVLNKLGMELDINKKIWTLTNLERMAVEFARAYLMGCSLLLIIHPEKMIGQNEYDEFHQMLRRMKELKISTLYVCYHHKIAFQICDRIAIYSSGRIRKIMGKELFTEDKFAPYAVYFDEFYNREDYVPQEVVLELDHVRYEGIRNLSLCAGKGECVTMLDPDNQIMDELVEILSRNDLHYTGTILYGGKELRTLAHDIVEARTLILDENSTESFLFDSMSYLENLCFLLDRKINRSLIKGSYKRSIRNYYFQKVGDLVDEPDIRNLSLQDKFGLVYNKIELFHPQILIIKKPFAYGNMYCRLYILERILKLKQQGICIILLTNNITDCLQVADRVEVIKNGESSTMLKPDEFEKIQEVY